MRRQRERLKETVRVEGPDPEVDRGGEGGKSVRLWKPWEEVKSSGGESRGGGFVPCGEGLLGSVGNPQFPSALLPTY